MASTKAATNADQVSAAPNPLDVVPNEMPFDVPYGPPISLERAQALIQAALAEARKRPIWSSCRDATNGPAETIHARRRNASLTLSPPKSRR
jgi:hypothetical protein